MTVRLEQMVSPSSSRNSGRRLSLIHIFTAHAKSVLSDDEILKALKHHTCGDWGDTDTEDRERNDKALVEGERLLSIYHTDAGLKFWIITEADRSVTTVLLPEDY